MTPNPWAYIGASAASLVWLVLVAWALDRAEQMQRKLVRTQAALRDANDLLLDAMAQSGRMARLAVSVEPTVRPNEPVLQRDLVPVELDYWWRSRL